MRVRGRSRSAWTGTAAARATHCKIHSEQEVAPVAPASKGGIEMPNGGFQQGTWNPLPSNCTRNFTLTYARCIAYGIMALTECVDWVVERL